MGKTSFLSVIPRAEGIAEYPAALQNILFWSDRAGLDGVLIFNGAGTVVDPWAVAVAAAATTSTVVPLVALNPVYQHPYLAARLVASVGLMYGRRVDLNLVTGAATGELAALGDGLDHDSRYRRLAEFTDIMLNLLASPRPYSFKGEFYHLDRLQITPALPHDLLPRLYVAGQSASRLEVMRRFGALSLQMLPPPGQPPSASPAGALNFGVITRPDKREAVEAARAAFPVDAVGSKIMSDAMSNTDSTWKRNLFQAAEGDLIAAEVDGGSSSSYWLHPFRSGQADCPYLVGAYTDVADRLAHFTGQGVRTFIIDLPPQEKEFIHLTELLAITRDRFSEIDRGSR